MGNKLPFSLWIFYVLRERLHVDNSKADVRKNRLMESVCLSTHSIYIDSTIVKLMLLKCLTPHLVTKY